MLEARPSRTALSVAMRRAAHRVLDRPLVLDDPLAVRVLGAAAQGEFRERLDKEGSAFAVGMRAFLVARSRVAEDALLAAVLRRGVTQYCLLGAGLDTFAYRNPHAGVQVFEVDHPATQMWKRGLLREAGITVPAGVTCVPVNFEREDLGERLAAAGFAREAGTLFAWLGVVPYLSLEAFRGTLHSVAGCGAGSGVVFDYGVPRAMLHEGEQATRDLIVAAVARSGEPFRLFFSPAEVAEELGGFREVEDLGAAELNRRYFGGREDGLGLRGRGGRVVCGWV